MSTTFHCPFCGAPITGPGPGETFACPYCRSKVMAPYAGPASGGPKWDGGASYQAQEQHGPFTTDDKENITVTVDPQLGPIAIGAFAPHGKPAVLRAWDMKGKKPLWEQLSGQTWVEGLEGEHVRILGRNVYVANKRQLFCLDLANGNRRWQAGLSDAAKGDDDGLEIADPFNPAGRGAILVPTVDHTLFALDRDSGQVLWNRPFGEHEIHVAPVLGMGACVVKHNGTYVKVDIINPAYPQSIAMLGRDHWSTDLGECQVSGRTVLTVVDDMGPEGDDDGLLCFDGVTGQTHFFDKVEDLEEDVIPCAIGPRAFAAMDDGAGLYVGPRGRAVPVPVPNHVIVAMMQAGPTLVLLLKKAHGTAIRRVVGIDPNTLAFRFDAGEAGTEPEYQWHQQMQTDGYSLVFVATPQDDMNSAELRSIDTSTGRQLWTRPARGYRSHRFVNGAIVVRTWNGFEVLQPQNGQVIASLS